MIRYLIAKYVMRRTQRLGTHELRAVAGSMLGWIDDELMGVVAEEIGLPRIICREHMEKHLWWADEPTLAKVVIGIVMLDGFSSVQQNYLAGKLKINAEKVRKEMV